MDLSLGFFWVAHQFQSTLTNKLLVTSYLLLPVAAPGTTAKWEPSAGSQSIRQIDERRNGRYGQTGRKG